MDEQNTSNKITVTAQINAPAEKVWEYYNDPEHVKQWNNASEDWHTPRAENDLRIGGSFTYRMEARDGSAGFDFGGTYDAVEEKQFMQYTMTDGRVVQVKFTENDGMTEIEVTFDPEAENELEFQRQGWQSILDNFKQYVESN